MKSILLIRYSALGDVVLATSLVAPLRARYPGARLAWVVERAYAELLEGVVDEVLPFSRKDGASRAAILQRVRGRFELCVDLQNKLWSLRVARAAAPQRLRFVRRTALQALGSLVGEDTVLDAEHATTLYARAAQLDAPGPLRLHVGAAAAARAAELLPGAGPWVALAPGAAWETKRWAPARFAQLARALKAEGARVALLGGAMDGALLDTVAGGGGVDVDLRAEPLTVLAAAAQRCRLLVGNDSGLAHVATAVGSRALALFGPTSVTRWGPRAPSEALSLGLACAPCTNHGGRRCPLGHHDCLGKLEVERVLAAARRLLAA